MLPQISATTFFCLGLTILCIGYIVVEILGGDNYRFKNSLDRNNKSLFDRILHYLVRGIIINFGFIVMLIFIKEGLSNLINMLNSAGNIGGLFVIKSVNGIDETYVLPIQFIVFSTSYFVLLLTITFACFYAWKLGIYLGGISPKNRKRNSK